MLVLGTYGARRGLLHHEGRGRGHPRRSLNGSSPRTTPPRSDNPELPSRPLRQRRASTARTWACCGQIHPLVAANYGIDADVYCAELDFTELLETAAARADLYPACPSIPAVTRDLASGLRRGRHRRARWRTASRAAGGKLLRRCEAVRHLPRPRRSPMARRAWPSALSCARTTVRSPTTDSEAVVTKRSGRAEGKAGRCSAMNSGTSAKMSGQRFTINFRFQGFTARKNSVIMATVQI